MQHKKILSILTAAAAAVCCALPFNQKNISSGGVMKASAASVLEEYREWSQLDSRWGNTPMGGTTIRRSGCLITSLAIMAVNSGSIDEAAMKNLGISSIEEFDPGVLANAYTKVGGFSSGGAIQSWGTIHTIIPEITWGTDTYFKSTEKNKVAKELRGLMDEGWHIIARVNNGGFHWVYIESVGDDDSITMCDPALDTHDLYEGYSGGLQGEYWAVKGTNPPGTFELPPAVGEYFVADSEPVEIYSEMGEGTLQTVLNKGNVVNISEITDNYGFVESDDFSGWVDISLLEKAEENIEVKGDLNGDRVVDKYDLSLLNVYLQQSEQLPDGISVLTSAQLEAADLNGDGVVDLNDTREYLMLI